MSGWIQAAMQQNTNFALSTFMQSDKVFFWYGGTKRRQKFGQILLQMYNRGSPDKITFGNQTMLSETM